MGILDKAKKALKIGAVAGMAMASSIGSAEAADQQNYPKDTNTQKTAFTEQIKVEVSGHAQPGQHSDNIVQEYKNVTAEYVQVARRAQVTKNPDDIARAQELNNKRQELLKKIVEQQRAQKQQQEQQSPQQQDKNNAER